MRNVIALSIVLLSVDALPVSAQEDGNAVNGREIAALHCTRCHVVGDINPNGGISSTPSFQMLVKRRPDYKDRFQTFHARRPHPAFLSIKGVGRLRPDLPPNAEPVEMTEEEVQDVLAYVETLKPTDKKKK